MNHGDKYTVLLDPDDNFVRVLKSNENAQEVASKLGMTAWSTAERRADHGDGKYRAIIMVNGRANPPKMLGFFKRWSELVDHYFTGDINQDAECREYVCCRWRTVLVIENKADAKYIAEKYHGDMEYVVHELATAIFDSWED